MTVLVRPLDWMEPEAAFERLAGFPPLVWLDSAGPVGERSRFGYLCVSPFGTIEHRNGTTRRDGVAVSADPLDLLSAALARWAEPGGGPVPFTGGAVGVFGFGLAGRLERLPRRHAPDASMPDLWVGLFDLVLAFDRVLQRCWLISSGRPESDPERRPVRAAARAAMLQERLAGPAAATVPLPVLAWHPERDAASYAAMVARGIALIEAGDIFQANLSMRHSAARPADLDPASVYRALRAANPAPFAAFLDWGDGRAICSASPERFIRLDADGTLETRPIKGTRPRAEDPLRDAQEAAMLAASVKDRAENLMIVDLMRNDLSRIARPGSVRVPTLCAVESFATVHHLVSAVTGRLRPDVDAVGVLRATFPGGSVTGAPKIRAIEVIDALERSDRGPYCGSIAWMGFDGAMDSSIVIRTLWLDEVRVVAQSGGGIVADSQPVAEYAEMLAKVAPLLSLFPVPR